MFNNEKIPFLSKVGLFISTLGYSFQNGGIKVVCSYIKNTIRITYFRFMYKHSKRYRNKILSNLTADNIFFLVLIDSFCDCQVPNMGKYVVYLNDEEKEKYKKKALESRASIIKNLNITDKKSLEGLNSMLGLDILGVKIEEEVKETPRKTTRRRLKKAYALPQPTSKVK